MRFHSAPLLVLLALALALPVRATDDALVQKVARANNAFGVALYQQFKAQPGNLVFSPYSLSSALALTAIGARGQTEKELWQALQLDLPREQVAAEYSFLMAQLSETALYSDAALTAANSLWPQQGYALKPKFLEIARSRFNAEVTPLDYEFPALAAAKINRWIAEKTAGLIRQIVDPAMLNMETRLTLCNAVHFKARWGREFSKVATKPAPFTLLDRQLVEVPTMKQTNWFKVVETADCRILCLGYTGGGFEMLIMLPNRADGLGRFERTMDAARIEQWMDRLNAAEAKYLALEMPKFKTSAEPECKKTLSQLGVKAAFDQGSADFSGMTTERGFSVGDVLHKALIIVNEEGTEAAATTTAAYLEGFGGDEEPPLPIPFKVDHPFLFFIREVRTGAILFMGRIVDPRAE